MDTMRKRYPSPVDRPYFIKVCHNTKVGDRIESYAPCSQVQLVKKVYKATWYRRLLKGLGFNVKINQAKVINLKIRSHG